MFSTLSAVLHFGHLVSSSLNLAMRPSPSLSNICPRNQKSRYRIRHKPRILVFLSDNRPCHQSRFCKGQLALTLPCCIGRRNILLPCSPLNHRVCQLELALLSRSACKPACAGRNARKALCAIPHAKGMSRNQRLAMSVVGFRVVGCACSVG